jgi:hypothetical protein
MIGPHETEIKCEWTVVDGKIAGNEACDRIPRLLDEYLVYLGSDASGWEQLFVDRADSRFWELTFPMSHMHGGGPPLLTVLSEERARAKYGEASRWPRS